MKKNLFLLLLFSLASNVAIAQNGMPTAAQIREGIAAQIKSFAISPLPVLKITDTLVTKGNDEIPIRIYQSNLKKNKQIIFNIHGGALVAGDLDTHDNISRKLALQTQSVVIAVDYKKPPEFPYPESINDCEAVLEWIKKNAKLINENSKNIVLVGDSGGGLIITSLAVKLKKELNVSAICLINPAVDLRNPGEGFYGLVTSWYLNGKDANDPLVSPILETDYSYFPKTLIITCQNDELKPHGIALYDKLKKAKIKTEILDIPNEDHLGGLWAAAHPKAETAIAATIKFIKTF
jgi:acetyl esterase